MWHFNIIWFLSFITTANSATILFRIPPGHIVFSPERAVTKSKTTMFYHNPIKSAITKIDITIIIEQKQRKHQQVLSETPLSKTFEPDDEYKTHKTQLQSLFLPFITPTRQFGLHSHYLYCSQLLHDDVVVEQISTSMLFQLLYWHYDYN